MVRRNFHDCLEYAESSNNATLDITVNALLNRRPRPHDPVVKSEAQCYAVLLFILIPIFNMCVLTLMIIFEIKSHGLQRKAIIDPKNQVIVTLVFLQILIFVHYSMAENVARIFIQTLEEGCRTVCFFLMMNFFMKQASKLLRNKKRWIKIYKILWPISLGLFLVTILWMIIAVSSN